MPILVPAQPSDHGKPWVVTIDDIPGKETGRIDHGGSCPLRGLTQRPGHRTPLCGGACIGPHEPFYARKMFEGVVLVVRDEHALVWNEVTETPHFVTLPVDAFLQSRAAADAEPWVHQAFTEWKEWETLVKEEAEAARKKREEEEALEAMIAKEVWEADEAVHRAAREAAAEEARQVAAQQAREAACIALLSSLVPKRGQRIRVIRDDPTWAEINRRKRKQNRQPSRVGLEGRCRDYLNDPKNRVIFEADSGETYMIPVRDCIVIPSAGQLQAAGLSLDELLEMVKG